MSRRVTVVTAGHLATCPRMLKAADALHEAGHRVRVISTRCTPWATEADRRVLASRTWRRHVIDYGRDTAALRWLATGASFKVARAVAGSLGASTPHAVAVSAFSRVHRSLVNAILQEPSDLIYGGTTGAIAAVAEAGRRSSTPFGVDFEDFHCGEHQDAGEGRVSNTMADAVMRDVARDAAFVTAGSAAIARACADRLGVAPVAIHNVFRLPDAAPAISGRMGGPLRLYWFSQTIGPGRGLEDVVRACGAARVPCELHLRGAAADGYLHTLRSLIERSAALVRLEVHAPGDPHSMIDACRGYDVGIAVEPGQIPNSALSLSNKALTYPLAGLALALTDTVGQRPLAAHLNGDAIVFAPGAVDVLASGLARWHSDPAALRRARTASWEAARARWHWEHQAERDTLLAQVAEVVS